MKIVRHWKNIDLVKHGTMIHNWHCMLYLRIDYVISNVTMKDSHISLRKEIFKRAVLVLILSNIVISDMESNTKIAAEVQMIKTHNDKRMNTML